MSRRPFLAYPAGGLCAILVVLAAATSAPAQPIRVNQYEGVKNEVIQTFPCDLTGKPAGAPVTGWKVHWATRSGNGLYLQGAWFRRAPQEDWIQVLGDARLSEAFVPYHVGSPRFWDVSYDFDMCPLTRADAGPLGQLLRASPEDKRPTVIKEIRDRGIMFKYHSGVRRGQTLILWAALEAGNYRYLIEYGFEDNGTITFRVGATGHNYGGSEWVPHMHNSMWRIDVNLGGKGHNSVELCEHIEPNNGDAYQANTRHTLLKKECGIDWNPYKFTMLRVLNTRMKNAHGKPVSYDLMPLRSGNSRHREKCTLHDFWVTAADPKQMSYPDLPEYIKKGRPIVDTDVVLWYNAPAHHEPRSEDGEFRSEDFEGATHVMWAGFDLRPANLFDRTPFFPYPPPTKTPLGREINQEDSGNR
jgi:primary-amine oxidase